MVSMPHNKDAQVEKYLTREKATNSSMRIEFQRGPFSAIRIEDEEDVSFMLDFILPKVIEYSILVSVRIVRPSDHSKSQKSVSKITEVGKVADHPYVLLAPQVL